MIPPIDMDELEAIGTNHLNPHTLPIEVNRRIFVEQIAPDLFAGIPARSSPSMVFVIAQQGAGKSTFVRRHARRLFGHDHYVMLDIDGLKGYHPDYRPLLMSTSNLPGADRWASRQAVVTDVQRWRTQAERWAMDRGVSMLVQHTAKSPGATADLMRRAGQAGMWRWAVFLGVPEAVSLQGRLYRFFAELDANGYGRLPNPAAHDAAYVGIPELAGLIEHGGLADRASVYRRDGFPMPDYDHPRMSSGAHRSGILRMVIEDERTRPLTEAESEDFVRRQAELWDRATPEFVPELRRIDKSAAGLVFPSSRAEQMYLRGVTGAA